MTGLLAALSEQWALGFTDLIIDESEPVVSPSPGVSPGESDGSHPAATGFYWVVALGALIYLWMSRRKPKPETDGDTPPSDAP